MLVLLLANSHRLVGDALESQTRSRLEALTPLLNASLAGRVFQRDHSEIEAILGQLAGSERTEIRYIVVLGPHGEPLAKAGEVPPERLAAEDRSVADALADLTYDTSIPLMLPGNTRVGSVRFGLSLEGLATLRGSVLRQSLLIAGAEVLLSLLLLASVGYLLTRHFAGLLAATRRVAGGDYATPIPIQRNDEIGVLADNFNAMTAAVKNRIGQLAESESRFRTIFDAAGDAIFIHDAGSGRLVDVNRRVCELYRCTHEQALAATAETFSANIGPHTAEQAAEWLRLTLEEGPQTFDWLARRLDGELFWVEVNLRHVQIGRDDRIVAIVRDISERKRAEEAMDSQAAVLKATLDNISQGISVVDKDLRLAGHNRRFQELLDFPDSLVREGTTFEDFIRYNAERGEYGPGDVETLVRARDRKSTRLNSSHT